ncbi:DUF1302 family protein [Marinithermus hydrothermalis]|uniref:Uncharacterized protein n=1 Tax=Marinithermus hydrothermalis (strain DSM 14884 / JCM 11576 / T1) TaxID=869210 RepID=F2NN83_MARHT|nr:DUF1302 family protein [Marinithermus hydrothermalis]AEB12822.1 hypothetical protein Marky_2097 [Marinithermus hydrothermalis DSM 14884]
MRQATVLTLALALAGGALAQSLEWSGSLKTGLGYRFSDQGLTANQSTLDLELSTGLEDADLTARFRFTYDALTGQATFALHDAYATVYLEGLDLAVGQQVVSWGSTDGINPVDALNPRDLRMPFADPQAQKLAVPMVRATFYPDEEGRYQLEAVLVPTFTPSTPPAPEWAPAQPLPPLAPGVVGVNPPETLLPEPELENVQFGLRATGNFDVLEGFDASVVLYRGFRHTPTAKAPERLYLADQDPDGDPTNGPFVLQPRLGYDRIHLIGLDFSAGLSFLEVEGVVVRGEAAYAFTEDPEGTDPYVANPYAQAVLGAEYTWENGLYTELQLIEDYQKGDQGQDDTWSTRLMLVSRYELDERWRAEGVWLHSLKDGSGLVAPSVRYTFADGVTGTATLLALYGAEGSELGSFRDNTQLRFDLEYAF